MDNVRLPRSVRFAGKFPPELEGKKSLTELTRTNDSDLRTELYLVSDSLGKAKKQNLLTDDAEKKEAGDLKTNMEKLTQFIPIWVKLAVAFALGLGTMIGWKRIVVTVGEKIGKESFDLRPGRRC